jgi:hypothetical protein
VKGELLRAWVQTVMLYGSETWPTKVEDTKRLHRNEMMMIRWICCASPLDRDSCDLLREKLDVTLSELMCTRLLRWFSHIARKEENCWLREIQILNVPGDPLPGRSPKSWREVTNDDLKAMGLAPEQHQS